MLKLIKRITKSKLRKSLINLIKLILLLKLERNVITYITPKNLKILDENENLFV